jgi:G3E family GTPase
VADKMVPVTVITGFLGSGKTTLLNQLLRDPSMQDTAVIINEFGEVSIDHLLVGKAIENTFVLENGCVCCSIRGDLVDTVLDLVRQAESGLIPPFSRILLETTGLAEPGSILRTLTGDPKLTDVVRLRAVVTTVDVLAGAATLAEFPEAVKQIAAADLILLTKGDLAGPGAAERARRAVTDINSSVTVKEIHNGGISADELFRITTPPENHPGGVRDWLAEPANLHDHDHRHHHHDAHERLGHGHSDTGIASFCVVREEPIPRAALEAWLGSIAGLRGHDLLRMKGVVNIAGQAGPLVIQGVQDVLYPVVQLPAWPDTDHRTRVVFIARHIPLAALENSLAALASSFKPANAV